jgi:cupin 2 domain-containing protein
LFNGPSAADGSESTDVLARIRDVTIERIVSSGTQPPARYEQAHDEWVLLVTGEAEMTVDGRLITLKAGDTLFLPAHVPHEVLTTSTGALWLAVHAR